MTNLDGKIIRITSNTKNRFIYLNTTIVYGVKNKYYTGAIKYLSRFNFSPCTTKGNLRSVNPEFKYFRGMDDLYTDKDYTGQGYPYLISNMKDKDTIKYGSRHPYLIHNIKKFELINELLDSYKHTFNTDKVSVNGYSIKVIGSIDLSNINYTDLKITNDHEIIHNQERMLEYLKKKRLDMIKRYILIGSTKELIDNDIIKSVDELKELGL